MAKNQRAASAAAAVPSEAPPPRIDLRGNERHFRIAMFAVVLLATLLRAKFLLETSNVALWNDELLAAEWSTGHSLVHNQFPTNVMMDAPPGYTRLENAVPIWNLWTDLRNDVQAPFYYIVLRLWRVAVADSDLSMQFLSVLFSSASVLLLVAGVRHLSGPLTALWSGLLMAVAPTQLLFSREVRPYALAVFMTLLAFWALMLVWKKGGKFWHYVLLGIAVFLSMFTHYYCLGVMLALAGWSVVMLRGKQRWVVLATFAITGVLFAAIWGPTAYAQYKNTQTSGNIKWMQDAPGEELSQAMGRVIAAPFRMFADIGAWGDAEGGTPLYLSGYLIFAICTVRLVWRRDLILPWLCMVLTLIVIGIFDIKTSSKQLTLARFLLMASPGFYVLVAGLASSASHRAWSNVLPAAIFLGAVITNITGLPQEKAQTFWRMPYDLVARVYEENGTPNEPLVFFSPGNDLIMQNTYLGLSHYFREGPRQIMLINQQPNEAHMNSLRKHDSFWTLWMFHRRTRSRFEGYVPVDRYVVPNLAIFTRYRRADLVNPQTYRPPELKVIGNVPESP